MPVESRTARRGLTIIELLVSLAVVSIVLAAVMTVVVAITRQRRDGGNQLDVRLNGRVALAQMQFDGSNAGFRFGTPPLAVRVLQNVAGTEPELVDANTDCGGQAGWTVQPETDVIEFRQGADGRTPGKVTSGAGCGATCSVVLNNTAFWNPLGASTEGEGQILFFSNGITGCVGRLVTQISSSNNLKMLKANLRTDAVATNYPTTGPGACPNNGMTVTLLDAVTRYVVCRPPNASNPNQRPMLVRQVLVAGPAGGPNLVPRPPPAGQWERVQDGVEDLQVATMLDNQSALVSGGGCTGTGAGARCWCNAAVGADCNGYNADPTAGAGALNGAVGAPAAERSATLARAFRVAVTTVALRASGYGEKRDFVRPASLDHVVGGLDLSTPYGRALAASQRVVAETTLVPQNIVMVIP